MRRILALCAGAAVALAALTASAAAEPPSWAPAHGWRAQHGHHHERHRHHHDHRYAERDGDWDDDDRNDRWDRRDGRDWHDRRYDRPYARGDGGMKHRTAPVHPHRTERGPYCREYPATAVVGGRPRPVYGTACRQPDGSWQIVSN